MPKISVAAAVNSEEILNECLLLSPDIASGRLPLKVYRGFSVFAKMGNQALADSDAEWVAILHQDIYLPTGFADRLEQVLTDLLATHPDAAVVGAIGVGLDGAVSGRVWSSGMQNVVGRQEEKPVRIQALDECVLIIRKSSNLVFDSQLPSFHLYGTDVVLDAEKNGYSAWVVDLPVIHHSRQNITMGKGYRNAWFYMRRKWKHRLPLANLVCNVTWNPLKVFRLEYGIRKAARGLDGRPQATGHPVEIARKLGWEVTEAL
jgi:hypothetical protein